MLIENMLMPIAGAKISTVFVENSMFDDPSYYHITP
jgi:hypothetical protein